jgi:hypothetical protein
MSAGRGQKAEGSGGEPLLAYLACLLPFILLATLNSAGYRYGASDQAFYVPSIVEHLHPEYFRRDHPVLAAQARFMISDELFAAIARVTGWRLPPMLFVLYLLTLALLLAAALRIGGALYRHRWTPVALAAALTLRHAIAKTGANTLEGYFHPRITAFALGLLAAALFLERRDRAAPIVLVAAAVMHPTVAIWFSIWLGAAYFVARPAVRRPIAIGAAIAVAFAAWALWRGPLAGHFVRIDDEWLAVIASKDYLFPLEWPLNVWMTNLIGVPAIVMIWRVRRRYGLVTDRETALVAGVLSLVVLFFCWLPFDAARLALAVQLQTSRLFWIVDVFATIYVVWAVAEGTTLSRARAAAALAALLAVSTGRGFYNRFIQFPDRPVFTIDLPPSPWTTAMMWARTTEPSSGWLADPYHAAQYGSSVRVAAERDVFLEAIKDSALAIYDRSVAMRISDRLHALTTWRWDTADGARALGRQYDLDYLVVDHPVALPEAYRSGPLFIYRLR